MATKYEYQFPEKVPFRAMEVTKPDFYIQSRTEWLEALYVNFNQVRDESQFQRLDYNLGLVNGVLTYPQDKYQKIIFSGHRGCGKSVELKRYVTKVNHPKAFFTVLIDLEQETSIEKLEPEDLFVAIITILVRELVRQKIKFKKNAFEEIAEEWLNEAEISQEVEKTFGVAAEAGVSIGWKFLQFLGVESHLKGTYSADNKTTHNIRRKIRTNPQLLVGRLNLALMDARQAVIESGLGEDLLIVLDGLEKANRSTYHSLFMLDPQMILGLGAHVIATVPIGTFYDIKSQSSKDLFDSMVLPMMRLNNETRPLLAELVLRRVDAALMDAGVLELFIEYSGGCPRQLLRLVNKGFLNAIGGGITHAIAEKTIRQEGVDRWRTLTSDHQAILRSHDFETLNSGLMELMESLNVFEYNGNNPERKISPLIADRFPKP